MESDGAVSGPIGAILAGGRSSRMGNDKALALLDGTPMVSWVAAALAEVVEEVVIVGRAGSLAGIPAVPDLRSGPRGPLAGLATALAYSGGRSVVLVAVDHPLVRPATLRGLVRLIDQDAVIPVDGGVRQITCAAYPGSWAEAADLEDRAGGSIQSLCDRLAYREVESDEWAGWGEDGRSWHSVDTPEELTVVLERFGVAGGR